MYDLDKYIIKTIYEKFDRDWDYNLKEKRGKER